MFLIKPSEIFLHRSQVWESIFLNVMSGKNRLLMRSDSDLIKLLFQKAVGLILLIEQAQKEPEQH